MSELRFVEDTIVTQEAEHHRRRIVMKRLYVILCVER